MPVTVLLGPAGSGKTGRAIDAFARCLGERGWRNARYLVPTPEHARAVTEYLLRERGLPGLLGRPIATFYDFADDIARQAQVGSRPLTALQRHLVMRDIVTREVGPYFERARHFPGFVDALGQQIEELKLAMVRPQQFEARLDQLGDRLGAAFQQKSRELLALYREYQTDVLERHHLHDPVGLMWHAVSALESNPALLEGTELIVLDGFQSFTPIQKRLVELLAGRVQVIVTLDHERGRPAVFESAEATRRWLSGLDAREETLPSETTTPPTLAHLCAHIFDLDPPRIAGDGAVTILEGANTANEVEMIARAVRGLLRDEGYRPGEIVVVARDPDQYARRIAATFARYGLPVAAPPMPAERTMLGRALAACVRVVTSGWQRADVVAALRSGLLDCDPTTVGEIEAAARVTPGCDGRERWREPWPEDESRERRQSALAPLAEFEETALPAHGAEACAGALRSLMDRLSWAGVDDPPLMREQMAARRAVERMLDEMVAVERLMGRETDWAEFSDLLAIALRETMADAEPPEGAIALLGSEALGGRRFRAVFVCGLLEKSFPRQMRESPFLRDPERRALNEGGLEIGERLAQQVEERYLFYSASAAATERLFLTYPEADLAARDNLPSFYLDEVRVLFDEDSLPIERADVSQVTPPLDRIESERERLDSTVHGIAIETDGRRWPLVAAAYNRWLGDAPDRLRRALTSALQREAALSNPRVLERLAARERPFAPSELEEYARCPFRHFCACTLGLEKLPDEPTPLDRGRVLHDVAAEWYRRLAAEGAGPPGFGGRGLDALTQSCLDLLLAITDEQPAYRNLADYERAMVDRDLAALLRRFVAHEVATMAQRPLTPAHFELSFGQPPRPDWDPRSSPDALIIQDDDRAIPIAGRIDRVDLDASGRALVIDYKSGANAPGKRAFEDGTALQVPLYVLAAERVFGLEPAGGEYYAVFGNDRSGFYADRSLKIGRHHDPGDVASVLARAQDHVRQFVAAIGRGEIAISPRSDEACRYCPCQQVCHVDRYARARQEAGDADA